MPLELQMCATYAVLQQFHTLNLRGKVSGYDFYHSLVHLTDTFEIQGIPDRLDPFMTIIQEHDPLLGPGLAYFVRSDEYLAHVEKYVDQAEISHCVGFAALWLANNKKAKGLWATRVGSVSCACHEIFRPTGTGNLQKEEQYCNMDYIFLSSITGFFILSLIVSYDIACQWYKNFWTCLQSMPLRLQFCHLLAIEYKVLKFYLSPHVPECHALFSFNYMPHVGRTDGEGVERNWSWLNGAAGSTSQMGPGGRHDMLDDFMGFSNFKKMVGLGDSLLRCLVLAIPQAMLHHQAFNTFTEGLHQEHAEEVVEWERMVEAWEADHLKPNPYALPDETIIVNNIRKDLAEEEHHNAEWGTSTSTDTSPSVFVISGLAIEDAQLLLKTEANKKNQTAAQMASIQECRTHLLRHIQQFQYVQATYMPGLHAYVAEHVPSPPDLSKLELIPIHLPSSIPTTSWSSRSAYAMHMPMKLWRTYTGSFGPELWPHASNQIEVKVRAAQSGYNVARTALLNLRGSGNWENVLQPLAPEDIHGMNEQSLTQEEHEADSMARELARLGPDDVGRLPGIVMSGVIERGEGQWNLSWIWYNITTAEVENDVAGSMHQCIQVEWAKAHARVQRWTEEVILLDEEMRRALEFGKWKAAWWEEQANWRECEEDALCEGVQAYAYEQADAERHLCHRWEGWWAPVHAHGQAALGSLTLGFRQSEDQSADRFEELEVEVDLVPEGNPENEGLDND
ncbi:hypothetical protein Hypma_001549 [Hypsizygus marmoreus]|uniref:CxC2-like cysteine cluster KDZ transposase-associated domain-containing protein n=1 Tax=Hypsizygus marmoreus TaxID=39966 RepID=A0A369KAY4_HYPMA|nr:hypothetical protein Hypma_001549 [Hypsizygus marmoreus]